MGTLVCVAALCSTPAQPAPGTSATAAGRVAADVVGLTNVERSRGGRARLRANPRLTRAAQIHAEQMARAARLAHVLPAAAYPRTEDRLAAAGYDWQTYGENVALGQANAASAVESWMRSRGHRQNILNSGFTELGAGYAADGSGRPYYVQVFAGPSS